MLRHFFGKILAYGVFQRILQYKWVPLSGKIFAGQGRGDFWYPYIIACHYLTIGNFTYFIIIIFFYQLVTLEKLQHSQKWEHLQKLLLEIMIRDVVKWEGGGVLKFFPLSSTLHTSQDPPGPPDSPTSSDPACSPVHERGNIYSEHKDLGSILYIPHLLIFALEADIAVSSTPLPEYCRLCFPWLSVAVAFWYLIWSF